MSDKIKELEKKLSEIASRELKISEAWDYNRPYSEYQGALQPIWDEYNKVNRELSLIKPYNMSEINGGDLMSLEDFIESCKGGMFIDYDGYGFYAKDGMESDIEVTPSDIMSGEYRKDFTHINWYNR